MDRLHSGSTDRRTAENTQAGDQAGKDRAATPTTRSAGSGVRHERIMSRSRRKTLIFGHAICRSERKDKQLWHRRWRAGERTLLASASPEALSAHLPLSESQVSDVYWMGKDGRSYWPTARQGAMAKGTARHQVRGRQEPPALKKRLLLKWMANEHIQIG